MGYGLNGIPVSVTLALANGASIVNEGTWTLSAAQVSAGAGTLP